MRLQLPGDCPVMEVEEPPPGLGAEEGSSPSTDYVPAAAEIDFPSILPPPWSSSTTPTSESSTLGAGPPSESRGSTTVPLMPQTKMASPSALPSKACLSYVLFAPRSLPVENTGTSVAVYGTYYDQVTSTYSIDGSSPYSFKSPSSLVGPIQRQLFYRVRTPV